MDMQPLQEDELQMVYNWVDEIPLSRPKKNITRDFSDGLLMAEVIKHYHPRMVEIHNYTATGAVQKKINNWELLNKKVLKRLSLQVSRRDIECIANHVPQAIERVLKVIIYRLEHPEETPPIRRGGGRSTTNLVASKNILNPELGASMPKEKSKGRNFQSSENLVTGTSNNPGANPLKTRQNDHGNNNGTKISDQTRERLQREVDQELLIEKEKSIQELQEHVEILEYRIKKLEQLVRLKDTTIKELRRNQGR
eukprot:CAMPEP_0115012288 /NCGR_PEP_ID=MMETSP0216-20121206/24630_1 /TAXON_ID=223996 /ORGANISM="Protocruzia adherens, Strain Boccale" /LENGTH=252 /DNA_ID=CAMNT_0002381281 /DNA_START=142 /DNA_END=900 /DNA_ORIENTATION=-